MCGGLRNIARLKFWDYERLQMKHPQSSVSVKEDMPKCSRLKIELAENL